MEFVENFLEGGNLNLIILDMVLVYQNIQLDSENVANLWPR